MRINFCTIMDDGHASFRYRILTPARELMFSGHDVSIGEPDFNADAMVFSKHYNDKDPEIAKEFKGTVVMDVCDYHLDAIHKKSEKWMGHYKAMLEVANRVTVSTDTLKNLLNGHGDNATVIPDPYEYEEMPPKFKWPQDGILQLFWFGNPSNLNALLDYAEEIDGHKVFILTNKKVVAPSGLQCSQWTPQRMRWGFDTCDAVVIPQNLTLNHFISKGPNRLIESVRQGRFVLAHPVPSYQEFAKWMWIGNIKEGIEWLKSNESEVEDRIKDCQDYVRDRYSQEAIGKKWEHALCR